MVLTVIAAARTGHLRQAKCYTNGLQAFLIRELLPCWVNLEFQETDRFSLWAGAAGSLRPVLSHASRWLGAPLAPSNLTLERRLTGEQVQELHSFFKKQGIPKLENCAWHKGAWSRAFEGYLPWLEEAGMAQQVADAWNSVVDRGEADKVKCPCVLCKDHE